MPFNVTESPSQIAISEPAFTLGRELTVTFTWSVLIQPLLSVPVTVYNVVEIGVKAVALVMLLAQLYVRAPLAFKANDSPSQMEVSFPASTFGKSFTVTCIESVLIHPLISAPITL